VENRIPIPHDVKSLPSRPVKSVRNLSIDLFIPTITDELLLREEFQVLIGRDLLKYDDNLKWMKPHISTCIPHKYDDLVKQKSNVVNSCKNFFT